MSTRTINQETFDALAFPVIRVKRAGATDYRGTRWIATCRRDNERKYRVVCAAEDGSRGPFSATAAALKCWKAVCADNGSWNHQHIAVPGDLDADSYAFTMVPRYIFNGKES